MPAPADRLGTIRRSMSAETKNVIASSAIANGAVNMWMRPPAGTDQRRRCFADCDFGINLDQLLAAGHWGRQHLIRHATDDVLNAAQKLNGEQDFYR
jgi:hypothetical protein